MIVCFELHTLDEK